MGLSMIDIRFFASLTGDAAALWLEGLREHIANGTYAASINPASMMAPRPDVVAWVAYVDGVPAAIQGSIINRDAREADGRLTYVVPAYRGQRLYAAIQPEMDRSLLAMGITHATFTMHDTDTSDRLHRTVTARGGEVLRDGIANLRRGPARSRTYRRALLGN